MRVDGLGQEDDVPWSVFFSGFGAVGDSHGQEQGYREQDSGYAHGDHSVSARYQDLNATLCVRPARPKVGSSRGTLSSYLILIEGMSNAGIGQSSRESIRTAG